MCGRFTIQYTWAEYHEALSLIPASAKGRNDSPRYNVAPTQTVGFVCNSEEKIVVKDGRWGIVPFFIKEPMKKPISEYPPALFSIHVDMMVTLLRQFLPTKIKI